ncbi:MAG TPA: serine/threonine-protein kinase, partial [Nannocystaceae bacterium]|nr:serine/threonine-protein kinase [Nannocystaceae bacterium]
MTGGRSSSPTSPKGEGETTIVEPADSSPSPTPSSARQAYLELAGLPDVILPGTLLGRYVVLEVVGRGGMGTVVRAYDPRLRREVAVKRLRPRASPEQAEARLVREARAMAQLNHPNVVAVYDVEAVPWGVLVAMEYVRGPTLREWLREPRSRREILEAFRQAGAGLAAAHAAGLVHRDFKPANVLMEESPDSRGVGRVRVTDFGLARGIHAGEPAVSLDSGEDALDAVDPSGDELTAAGLVLGTPVYMAPEQHAGETAGPAADQYAFCVALWEALAGARPFEAEDHEALARAKAQGPPPWPRPREVPARISQAIRRGLAPDPGERFPTMAEL